MSSPTWCPPVGDLDAVFWFDNIEHLQIDPTAVMRKLSAALGPEGTRVDFEHEYVHRREYTLPEIKTCLREAGLHLVEAEFLWQNQSEGISKSIFRGIEYLLPRFRPHMLIRALKAPFSVLAR